MNGDKQGSEQSYLLAPKENIDAFSDWKFDCPMFLEQLKKKDHGPLGRGDYSQFLFPWP